MTHGKPSQLILDIDDAISKAGLPANFVIGLLTTIAANMAVEQQMPQSALVLHAENSYDMALKNPRLRRPT